MPTPSWSLCTYRTEVEPPWRDEDYSAWQFIQAIKGEEVRGFGHVPVGGTQRRVEQANRNDALEWFAEMARAELTQLFTLEELTTVVIVPIPGKAAVVGTPHARPRTSIVAARLAELLGPGAAAWDGLRWTKELLRSREGGPRDAPTLYAALTTTLPRREGCVVLLDDVITSTAHMRAASARLRKIGMEPIVALAAGRADAMQVAKPFDRRFEMVEDFEP